MKITGSTVTLFRSVLLLSTTLVLFSCSSEEESVTNTEEARGVLTEQQENALDAANNVGDILQQAADDTEKELNQRLGR